ncbi:MAG: acetate--CoA ligase family protein [candidate division WOR-3 bacterium]|jgi:acetyltransferase|nr:acetate--CoA ligase family protein [candidate division WOR-3 bacterium]MCR4423231.1 acetate--CoA ligase family protein [candidate division WOR-3 bacterium]MDH7518570.1 acetate--CoA ligase family protein [bacterium]
MKSNNLDFIFKPRSIAVIGASSKEGSVGRALFANILFNGYTGVVFPVNPKAKSILGVKAYPSVLDINDEIDLAILIVPAITVPAVLAECGQKKIKGAIVISAGFKELGTTGAALEQAVKERARTWGIRLVGPNCFGMINTSPTVRLNTTFGRVMPRTGNIALISQSGAVGVNALEYAESEEVGLSKFISIGNKADINECDLLEYLKDDEETDVIALYLEDLVNPPEFMRIAREITSHSRRPKPILAIKAGRTTEGARAASSHTGALAGSDEAYNAFFSQARILRVDTVSELIAKAAVLAYQPTPRGPRVAIITNAGGVGIMATDACVRYGLKIAPLTEKTRTELKKVLPPAAAINNPVDIIGDGDANRYRAAFRILLQDENIDGVIPIWTPTVMAEAIDVANVIAEEAQNTDKPILACIQTMGDNTAIRRALLRVRIPHFLFPENAARALATMAEFGRLSRRPPGEVVNFTDVQTEQVREIVERAKNRPRPFISEPECHQILKAYGIPVAEFELATSISEALTAAKKIGYPVAIKIVSPDIIHKTDFGGVRINITSDEQLQECYTEMLKTIKSKKPDAEIWGVMVQKMAPAGGLETILGMKRDPHFGPLLMFGLGGILVEVLKDVVFRVAPVNDLSAESMITGIRAYRLLEPFRGKPARDKQKIKESIQRLSQLVTDFPEFDEIDINPLFVYEEGKGALVIDARMLL